MTRTFVEKVQLTMELAAFFACILATIFQQVLVDYYFIYYSEEKSWFWLIVSDFIVVVVMIWMTIFAIRYNNRYIKTHGKASDPNLPYAFITWIAYAGVLGAKIFALLIIYGQEIYKSEGAMNFRSLQVIFSMAALVFLLILISHHCSETSVQRQKFIGHLSYCVTTDLIDNTLLLQMLGRNSYQRYGQVTV